MKKLIIFQMILVVVFIFSSCQNSKNVEYSQKVLTEPDSIIVIVNGTNETKEDEYAQGSEKYIAIFNSMKENWWKMPEEKENLIEDSLLREVEELNEIRVTQGMEYSQEQSCYIEFLYDKNPFSWCNMQGESMDVKRIRFHVPQNIKEDRNTKGMFSVSPSMDRQVMDEYYTFYYADDIYNALSADGKNVKSFENNSVEMWILDSFVEITVPDMKDVFLTTYAWTRLNEHSVYWDAFSNTVVINYGFDQKVDEEVTADVGDYWKTMDVYRNYQRTNHQIYDFWSQIPDNANVVIQLFEEQNLVSQWIYEEIEDGIIYKQTYNSIK